MARTRCDRTPAWSQLQAAYQATGKSFDIRTAFAQDATRFERLSQDAPYVFADLSKNRLDAATEALLLQLAEQSGVQEHRDAMFAGDKINNTENREVWHTLLRNPPVALVDSAQPAINSVAFKVAEQAKVHTTLDAMLAFAEQVRGDAGITDVLLMNH